MAGILSTDPGFARGQTLGVTDPQQGTSVTGTTKVFTDTDPRTGQHLSNRAVTCVAARNTSGSPLIPGTCVTFKAEAMLDEVSGLTDSYAAQSIGIVDEYLPASGCANNDVCWIVVHGPVLVRHEQGPTYVITPGAGVAIYGGYAGGEDSALNNGVGYVVESDAQKGSRIYLNVPH